MNLKSIRPVSAQRPCFHKLNIVQTIFTKKLPLVIFLFNKFVTFFSKKKMVKSFLIGIYFALLFQKIITGGSFPLILNVLIGLNLVVPPLFSVTAINVRPTISPLTYISRPPKRETGVTVKDRYFQRVFFE